MAFYTAKENINEEDVRNFLMKFVEQRRIEKFWIPDEFIRVESFVKGSTGKIDKKALRQRYEKQ